jgi:hypothetical protein
MEDIRDILYITNKGAHMNAIEKYHIYKITKEKQINARKPYAETRSLKPYYTTIPHRWLHISHTPHSPLRNCDSHHQSTPPRAHDITSTSHTVTPHPPRSTEASLTVYSTVISITNH